MARLVTAFAAALVLALVAAPPATAAWRWPLRGEVITRYRNGADPYTRRQHRGIDIAGAVGAPVVAATAGVVRFGGPVGYSGLTVGMRTADGRYDTSYLHLSAIAVHRGERVAAGERLGAVGTTGRRSAVQSHLHFGVRDAGSRHGYHDPLDFLPPPARPRPAPRRTPTPVGAPARPSPAPVPLAAPRPAFRPLPDLHRAPAPSGVAAPQGAAAAAPHRVPEAGPSSHSAPARGPLASSAPLPGRPPHADHAGRGPDLGWALLCAGLLLAAGLTSLAGDGRRPTRRLPARVGPLVRPRLGRG